MELRILPDNDNIKILYSSRSNYTDDAGIDLICPEDITIPANSTSFKINLRIKCEMKSHTPVSYMLIPRSSMGSRTPLRLSNSIGIIDKGYRGNIIAIVDNISDDEYCISKGDRLFQICHPLLMPLGMNIVSELSETERGTNGLGSTG